MAETIRLNPENTGLYNINLNGATYFLRTYWNQYANRWFLDFKDENDIPIAMGLAIVNSVNLFANRPALCFEIGELWPFDLSGEDCQNREVLGTEVVLVYFLPGEFKTLFPDFNDVPFRELGYSQDDFDSVLHLPVV